MDHLSKLETAGALSAIRAVINSVPELQDNHPLKTAEKKLEKNLEEYNAA